MEAAEVGGRVSEVSHSPTRPDRYAVKAVWAAALGYAMDGFDLLLVGFVLPALIAAFHLTPPQAGSVATATLVGAVVGGILFGVLSDYVGRVRVLTWTIVLFAAFTGITALVRSYDALLLVRFIAGLGLGGEFGIGMTLAAEAWPAALRARATSLVALGWQGGVLLAVIASSLLLPAIGWRGLFVLGVAPALLAFFVRRHVEEPSLFAARHGERHGFPLWLLWKDARTAAVSLGLLVLTSVQNFGYYGIMIWLPSYLAGRFHYGFLKTGAWTGLTVAGMAVGIYAFGVLADRFGRRPLLLAFQVGAAVSVLVYSQLTSSYALLVGGAIMGFFVNGMLGGYGALMAEHFPTEARATAENVLFNIGRGVGGFAPVVIGTLAPRYGLSTAIGLLALIYVLDMFATVGLIPESRGARLA